MAEGKGCRKQLERLKLFLPPRASKVALKNFFYLEGGGVLFISSHVLSYLSVDSENVSLQHAFLSL